LLGFLAYNLARTAVALVRRNGIGAKLCLAQTHGLFNGFREPISMHSQAAPELRIVRRRDFTHAEITHAAPTVLAGAGYYANDEFIESRVGSSTA
jgi:hypothetical protein